MGYFACFIRLIVRFLVVWFVDPLSLLLTARFAPGVELTSVQGAPVFVIATKVAFLPGFVNFLIRPLILPALYLLVITISVVFIASILQGAMLEIDLALSGLGWMPES